MRDERGPWYLLTGLILGLAFGLVYAWIISPVQYVDTTPASLRADFKNQYRALISAAFLANGDLDRARARLRLLEDENPAQSLLIQAQLAQTAGSPESEVNAMAKLVAALNPDLSLPTQPSPTLSTPTPELTSTLSPTPVIITNTIPMTSTPELSITPSQGTIRGTITPNPTVTPLPTRTASPTAGEPFVLVEQSLVCDPPPRQPLIQVEALDAAEQPVPGIEIIVSWEDNQDHFFTGLKPEISLGYADFVMTPGVVYVLQLAKGGEAVPDLTPAECEASDGSRYWGSWKLVFIQP